MTKKINKNELQKIKELKKKKNPKFIRHHAHHKKRLEEKWRRPKGLQNKLRLQKKSRGSLVKSGYRTPKSLRNHSKNMKEIALIHNINELSFLKPETHDIIIAKMGSKKRLELINKATELGFTILNINIEKEKEEIETKLFLRKEKRKEIKKKKEEQKESLEQAIEKADKKNDKESEEKLTKKDSNNIQKDSQKNNQKKEFDKLLTKKDN